MKLIIKKNLLFILTLAILLTAGFSQADAAILYTRTQYQNLYNEKVAVELELKTLQIQYSNEKANLKSKIKSLEDKIDELNKKIANLKKQGTKDRELCDDRVKELQGTIDILQKKSSNREKDLISENKKLQARYEAELKKARQTLKDERNKNIEETDALKKKFNIRIAELENTINNLNNELSSLKKLSQAQKKELQRMSDQANELEKQLENEIKLGQIRLKKFHNKLVINLDDKISFDSGSAKLKKEIKAALGKITKILVKYPENQIIVEGHTDNVPIRSKLFRNNWQLSTERALSVLGFLFKNKKLNKTRFGAAGYAEFKPIVPNNSKANKALNRRVDIVLIPRISKK